MLLATYILVDISDISSLRSPTQSISSTPVRPSQQGTVLTAVDWLKRARRIEARFNEIVANDSVAYVQTLCVNFLLDKDKASLHESSISLSKLRKTIYTCHAEILQACGVGDELSKVEAIEKEIQTAISWVEEVFCYAIVDWTEVERLFRARNFMYQTVDSGMA